VARAAGATTARTRRISSICGRKFWRRRDDIVHHRGVSIDPNALPDDPAALQQMLRELYAENDKLRLLIERLTRHQFGPRSEQLTVEQLQLGLEDQEQVVAENQVSQAGAAPAAGVRTRSAAARNHGVLPSHLPRYEVVIDVAHEACPCCGGQMHCIGELRTEQLDIVPTQLRVRVTRRPRYACRARSISGLF